MMRIKITLILCILISISVYSQDKYDLQGYVSGLGSLTSINGMDDNLREGIIHNRLNFSWFINDKYTFNAQMRNRLLFGNKNEIIPGYNKSIEFDSGWMGLSWNLISEQNYLLNSNIDRFNIDYNSGKFNITIGRQRINWGKTYAFNVNDIFNAYSFFEVDYPERPGSDAIRIQYFPSYTSVFEISTKADHRGKVTIAGLYRFNFKEYDIQFIGGMYNETDWVVGGGWEGVIGGMGFKGEATYLYPKNDNTELNETFLFSTSLDYTFSNSLMLFTEALYNSNSSTDGAALMNLASAPADIRGISYDKFSMLFQATYPLTSLLNGTMAIMYMPNLNGIYTGPTLEYSLKDNLYLSLIYQYFGAKPSSDFEMKMHIAFLNLKWNF